MSKPCQTDRFACSVSSVAGLATGPAVDIPAGRIAFAFFVCVGLAVVVAYAIKYFQRGGQLSGLPSAFKKVEDPGFQIQATRRASIHADVSLVTWNGTDYLIGMGPGGITVIDKAPTPDNGAGK